MIVEKLIFRTLEEGDWEEVSAIYRQGIESGNATFQTEIPNWEEWNAGHLTDLRVVAEIESKVVGWAALSPVSNRCVYKGVAEVSVYVSKEYKGTGIGTGILGELIQASEENGIWTLQAGIFPENVSSLKLHEKLGFRKVGYREKLGNMNGVWRDVFLLERRSNKIGVE